jgi:hypothetical protein
MTKRVGSERLQGAKAVKDLLVIIVISSIVHQIILAKRIC